MVLVRCTSQFSQPDSSWCKKKIIFGVNNSSSVHVNNKKKNILVLGEAPAQRLDATTITAEAKYFINFKKLRNIFVLSLHYNCSNSSKRFRNEIITIMFR